MVHCLASCRPLRAVQEAWSQGGCQLAGGGAAVLRVAVQEGQQGLEHLQRAWVHLQGHHKGHEKLRGSSLGAGTCWYVNSTLLVCSVVASSRVSSQAQSQTMKSYQQQELGMTK